MTSILLVLRSLMISVTGFWRYLVVLPFLLAVVLAILIVYVLLLSVFWPLAHAFPLVIAGLFVFAFLVAIRTAFASIGEYGAPMFFRLLKSGLIFAVVQAVLIYMITQNSIHVLMLADGLAIRDIVHIIGVADQTGEAHVVIGLQNLLVWLVLVLILVAVIFVSVGIMVPMAASAWSASEGRAEVDPIWGFGAQFLPLVIVLGVTFVLQVTFGTNFKIYVLLRLVVDNFIDWMLAEKVEWPETELLIDWTLGFLLGSFLYYWQACAAALAFLAERTRRETARKVAQVTPVASRVDPRALRKARDMRG